MSARHGETRATSTAQTARSEALEHGTFQLYVEMVRYGQPHYHVSISNPVSTPSGSMLAGEVRGSGESIALFVRRDSFTCCCCSVARNADAQGWRRMMEASLLHHKTGRKEGRFSMTPNRSKSENKLRTQEAAGERTLHRSEPRGQTKSRIIDARMEKTMDRNPSNQDRKWSDKSEGWHQRNVNKSKKKAAMLLLIPRKHRFSCCLCDLTGF